VPDDVVLIDTQNGHCQRVAENASMLEDLMCSTVGGGGHGGAARTLPVHMVQNYHMMRQFPHSNMTSR
jgi:hypothetical protein